MREKLRRYMTLLRIVGVVVILAILALIGYQLYEYWSPRLGYTPRAAIQDYFTALAEADYETVYRMTAKESLTDIYGRPVTKAEFIDQLRGLTGDQPFPFQAIEPVSLFEDQGSRFYRVTLRSTVGGSVGESQLVVEVRRQENTWLITYPFAIVL